MRKIFFISILLLLTNAYPANFNFSYSPGSLYFGGSNQSDSAINVEDNGWGFVDRMGYFYFSKMSLSITSKPEKIDIPGTDNRFAVNGIFFDVMHKELKLEPVNIKYLEDGGRTHAVTYVLGYTYQWLFSESMDGFTFAAGIGLARTYFYSGSFKERTGSDNIAPVCKIGMGYGIKTGDNLFLNFGFDLISPAITYHKERNGDYLYFLHGGIYPYIGICFWFKIKGSFMKLFKYSFFIILLIINSCFSFKKLND